MLNIQRKPEVILSAQTGFISNERVDGCRCIFVRPIGYRPIFGFFLLLLQSLSFSSTSPTSSPPNNFSSSSPPDIFWGIVVVVVERLISSDDHLQGRPLWTIICKRLVDPNDH